MFLPAKSEPMAKLLGSAFAQLRLVRLASTISAQTQVVSKLAAAAYGRDRFASGKTTTTLATFV